MPLGNPGIVEDAREWLEFAVAIRKQAGRHLLGFRLQDDVLGRGDGQSDELNLVCQKLSPLALFARCCRQHLVRSNIRCGAITWS